MLIFRACGQGCGSLVYEGRLLLLLDGTIVKWLLLGRSTTGTVGDQEIVGLGGWLLSRRCHRWHRVAVVQRRGAERREALLAGFG